MLPRILKTKVCVFLPPEVARGLKIQAARMGCRGLSECFEKLWKLHEAALAEQIDGHVQAEDDRITSAMVARGQPR